MAVMLTASSVSWVTCTPRPVRVCGTCLRDYNNIEDTEEIPLECRRCGVACCDDCLYSDWEILPSPLSYGNWICSGCHYTD